MELTRGNMDAIYPPNWLAFTLNVCKIRRGELPELHFGI